MNVPAAPGAQPDSSQAQEYRLVCSLFLRLLALVYLMAFASIGVQIVGLPGSEGIFPFSEALQSAEGQLGLARYLLYPNLLWIEQVARETELSFRGLQRFTERKNSL